MLNGSVWVTGAAGFVGQAIVRRLRSAGHGVVGLGHAPEGSVQRSDPMFVAGDFEPGLVERAIERFGLPDTVIHAAGGASIAAGQASPFDDYQRTVTTTASLVHTLGRLAPDTRVLLLSSAAVYGDAASGPLGEDTPCAPVSHYGWHKLLAEQLCRQATDTHGLRCVVVRFFSIYGPGLRKQVLWDVGRRLLTTAGPVDIDATGEETRDLLHIEDVADLVSALMRRDLPAHFLVNGGSGRAVRLADLLGLLSQSLGMEGRIRFTGAVRPGNPQHLQAATERLSGLSFEPRRTLAEGMTGYARWLRDEARQDPAIGGMVRA